MSMLYNENNIQNANTRTEVKITIASLKWESLKFNEKFLALLLTHALLVLVKTNGSTIQIHNNKNISYYDFSS